MPEKSSARLRVERVCGAVAEALPDLVSEAVVAVRERVAGYGNMPVSEQQAWVTSQMSSWLDGLAHGRGPTLAEIEHARELGRARVGHGLPIEDLLGAYHVAYQVAWEAIVARAADEAAHEDEEPLPTLFELMPLVWEWNRVITSAVSEAYSEELRRGQLTRALLRQRLLDLLADNRTDRGAIQTARRLGFTVDQDFQAFAMRGGQWNETELDQLQLRLESRPGVASTAVSGSILVLLSQGRAAEDLLAAISMPQRPSPPAGVGARRRGLDGAAASIDDAVRCLPLAEQHQSTVFFEREWMTVSVYEQADRLSPLLDAAVRTASGSPHLADAVVAFAAELSVRGAATKLHVHPNTVIYRLKRWHELTGWDPRTGAGLAFSMVTLDLYRRDLLR
jgi:hypothetical protein